MVLSWMVVGTRVVGQGGKSPLVPDGVAAIQVAEGGGWVSDRDGSISSEVIGGSKLD